MRTHDSRAHPVDHRQTPLLSYFAGLSLLCYCLWLVWISFPIVHSELLFDSSTKTLYPAFLAPLTCLLLIPIGLLLLCFAVLRDRIATAKYRL